MKDNTYNFQDFNFLKTHDIFEAENSQQVKIDPKNFDVLKITNMLSESFRQQAAQSDREEDKQEYESWALIHKLAFVDKLRFTYSKQNSNQECPKTFLDNLTI